MRKVYCAAYGRNEADDPVHNSSGYSNDLDGPGGLPKGSCLFTRVNPRSTITGDGNHPLFLVHDQKGNRFGTRYRVEFLVGNVNCWFSAVTTNGKQFADPWTTTESPPIVICMRNNLLVALSAEDEPVEVVLTGERFILTPQGFISRGN